MAGFSDLVLQSQPAFFGGGVNASPTEGQTWQFKVENIVDNAGDPIDFTSITGTCKVYEGSAVIITPTVTGGSGTVTISATKAATAGLTGTKAERQCRWGLKLDNGTISVMFWAPKNSAFTILSEDGVA